MFEKTRYLIRYWETIANKSMGSDRSYRRSITFKAKNIDDATERAPKIFEKLKNRAESRREVMGELKFDELVQVKTTFFGRELESYKL